VNKNELDIDIPEGLVFRTDPKLLFIIIRNAVDNANKYTHHGRIHIAAGVQNNILTLKVSDTGRGMDAEMVREMTNIEERHRQGFKERSSMGFYIMGMLTHKLGGTYTIDSLKGKGTSLHFSFPALA
jgi:signal transduction histidine kinase